MRNRESASGCSALRLQPCLFAQTESTAAGESLITMPGIIITLLIIPLVAALLLVVVKANALFKNIQARKDNEEATRFAGYLKTLNMEQLNALQHDREHQDYHLNNRELSGPFSPEDSKGLLSSINERANIRFIEAKRKALNRPDIDPALSPGSCFGFWALPRSGLSSARR